jgi:hypothetical protein
MEFFIQKSIRMAKNPRGINLTLVDLFIRKTNHQRVAKHQFSKVTELYTIRDGTFVRKG